MKKILFPMLAAAAIVAAPAAYAKSMTHLENGSWRVLADANTRTCFTSNEPIANGEVNVSGPYASQSLAATAMSSAIQCGGYDNRS